MAFRISNKQADALHKAALVSFPSEVELQVWVAFNWVNSLNQIKKSNYLPAIVLDLFVDVEAAGGWDAFLTAGADSNDRPVFRDACKSTLAALTTMRPIAVAGQAGGRDLLILDSAPFVDRQPFWIDIEELRTSNPVLQRIIRERT